MFTGIIEAIGTIERLEQSGSNTIFWLQSPVSHELKIDQSVNHNGVCLTVDALDSNRHRVTAIAETLAKTNLGEWKAGDRINLERCLQVGGRYDGHIVQGHVDCKGTCVSKKDLSGSWEFRFRFPDNFASLIIEKGSISLNGTSLTIFDIGRDEFSVAIIPYTYSFTNIGDVEPGHSVNIEFDMIGKYISRIGELGRTSNI